MRQAREGLAEALQGEDTGRVMEPRNFYFGKPTLWLCAEGNNRGAENARHSGVPRGRRPWHVRTCYAREPGDPGFAREAVARAVSGSLRTGADDERTREVGQVHSTGEVTEQGQTDGGGGDGGKGLGQGEPEPAKRVPNAESGRRAKCAGAGTRSSEEEQGDQIHRAVPLRDQGVRVYGY